MKNATAVRDDYSHSRGRDHQHELADVHNKKLWQKIERGRRLHVVGDRVKATLNHSLAISIDDFRELVGRIKEEGAHPAELRFEIGQGLAHERIESLVGHAREQGAAHLFVDIPDIMARATKAHTHKHEEKNIHISEPLRLENGHFSCRLLIDERCSDMSDHLTGKHIQGMVLIEAARQMVLAVSEKYMLNGQKGPFGFITHRTDARFEDFVFPVQVSIELAFKRVRSGAQGNFRALAQISFIQRGKSACAIDFEFSCLAHQFLSDRESALADEILTHI